MTTLIALGTGKGGVGKTSLAVNLGDLLAQRGLRVLIVDVDVQGDAGEKLGVVSDDDGVQHRNLLEGGAWEPVYDVRPNLDVLPAGPRTMTIYSHIEQVQRDQGRNAGITELAATWRQAFAGWDVVLFDTPPAEQSAPILDPVLAACDFLVIPTRHDPSSLRRIATLYKQAARLRRDELSKVEVVGIVLFEIEKQATRIRRKITRYLEENVGELIDLFDAYVPHSMKSDFDLTWEQDTVREYAQMAERVRTTKGLKIIDDDGEVRTFSATAPDLLAKYEALVDELVSRTNIRVEQPVTAGV